MCCAYSYKQIQYIKHTFTVVIDWYKCKAPRERNRRVRAVDGRMDRWMDAAPSSKMMCVTFIWININVSRCQTVLLRSLVCLSNAHVLSYCPLLPRHDVAIMRHESCCCLWMKCQASVRASVVRTPLKRLDVTFKPRSMILLWNYWDVANVNYMQSIFF